MPTTNTTKQTAPSDSFFTLYWAIKSLYLTLLKFSSGHTGSIVHQERESLVSYRCNYYHRTEQLLTAARERCRNMLSPDRTENLLRPIEEAVRDGFALLERDTALLRDSLPEPCLDMKKLISGGYDRYHDERMGILPRLMVQENSVRALSTLQQDLLAHKKERRRPSTEDPEPQLLTQDAAWKYLGVSRTRWFQLKAADQLPRPVTVAGSRQRWRRSDLDRYIKRLRTTRGRKTRRVVDGEATEDAA